MCIAYKKVITLEHFLNICDSKNTHYHLAAYQYVIRKYAQAVHPIEKYCARYKTYIPK